MAKGLWVLTVFMTSGHITWQPACSIVHSNGEQWCPVTITLHLMYKVALTDFTQQL